MGLLQTLAGGDVGQRQRKEQQSGDDEDDVEHDGYQVPFFEPIHQTRPAVSVVCDVSGATEPGNTA